MMTIRYRLVIRQVMIVFTQQLENFLQEKLQNNPVLNLEKSIRLMKSNKKYERCHWVLVTAFNSIMEEI